MPNGILALDLATAVGWAHWAPPDPAPTYGTLKLPDTGASMGGYLRALRLWFEPKVQELEPDWVMFEKPWVSRKTTEAVAKKLMGLSGFVEEMCREQEIEVRACAVGSIRKHFIGRGNLKGDVAKAEVMQACKARGWNPANYDESDALAVLDYSLHELRIQPPWTSDTLWQLVV